MTSASIMRAAQRAYPLDLCGRLEHMRRLEDIALQVRDRETARAVRAAIAITRNGRIV